MERKVVITNDGSSSLYLPELDEHYHSSHGAIQEARHVFIKNGLNTLPERDIVIFELGFGTGLNAFLTFSESSETKRDILYLGLEAYPVAIEQVKELNYTNVINEELAEIFLKMHCSAWDEKVSISPHFKLRKIKDKVEDFEGHTNEVDLIYFDAFGYRAQAEIWDLSVLRKMYELLKVGGVLVTYAARGQFKRDLKSLGFIVESLPGPPGKREMTRAIKQ